jgi:hypothetical protein
VKKLALLFAFGSVVAVSPMANALAATVPCETMLKDLRAAATAAKLDDAAKAEVNELESKGIERCNADDDKHADEFFSQAMKVVGK